MGVGNGGCCLTAGNSAFSTVRTAVAVGLGVGVTVGLAWTVVGVPGGNGVSVGLTGRLVGVPLDNGVTVGVTVCVGVMVAGAGAVRVPATRVVGSSAHRSPGPGCPAKAMVPWDRSR